VPLRLAGLPDALVGEFAEKVFGVRGEALAAQVRHADGAIGKLVEGAAGAGKAMQDARALLESIKAGGGARFERSLKQPPWSARGAFTDLLDALADELSGRARDTAAHGNPAPYVAALERVQAARAEAQRNVNPQLLLASLAGELAEVL
jgi:hypothetical protein